jgi:hypothetical protein
VSTLDASRQSRRLCLLTTLLLLFGCATAQELKPIEKTLPQARAQSIYEMLLAREGRTPSRDPRTLAGFPEAPTEVAQQLEALAASKRGQERDALLELAKALRRTGLYSRVLFRVKHEDTIVKYRPIALADASTAHAGWNELPIGSYHVWAERRGIIASAVNEYDVIQREIIISVGEN